MQLVQRRDAGLGRLDHDLVAHAVRVIEPEVGRRRPAAGQREQHAAGDVLLGQAGLLREDAVIVDRDSWRIEDLLDVNVHRAGNASKLLGDLLGDAVVRLRFRQRARDLYVDRGGQAEVEDLAHDVRRLGEELEIREPMRQLLAEHLQVFGGRAVRLLERHQDLAIGRSDRDTVAERQVDGIRHPDVVDDHVDLVGGDDLADVVLDLLEVDLRLLDPRPRWSPDVEPKLPGIDGWEEVPADERVQRQRGEREGEEHRDHHEPVRQRPVERALVGSGEPAEAGLERVRDPPEQ